MQACSQQRQDMFREGLSTLTDLHWEVCPSILPAVKQMDYVCSPDVASMCIQHYGMYLSGATPNKQGEACRYGNKEKPFVSFCLLSFSA